jgi:predicted dinucleotide-binding enzyme
MPAEPKKVGIIGSGIVGQTLASGFIKHGYSAMIGSRDPGKLIDWKSKNGKNAAVGGLMGKAEAARAIEPLCMLWCIPGMLRNDWAHAFKFIKP